MSGGQTFANTQRHDPYRDFNFKVTFVGKTSIAKAGFANISGIKAVIDYLEHTQGGNNGAPYQIADGIRFEPIVMQRGMSESLDLITAFKNTHDSELGMNNLKNMYTVTIELLDRDMKTRVKKFVLYDAWISSLETSEFNAMGGGVFLEKIVLSYTDVDISNN